VTARNHIAARSIAAAARIGRREGGNEGKHAMRHAKTLLVAMLAAAIPFSAGQAESLRIEQGVIVKFGKDAGLVARDQVIVADDVTLTSRQDDSVGAPVSLAAPGPESQNWLGLRYERSAHVLGSLLGRNLFLRQAGTADTAALQLRGYSGTLDMLRIDASSTGLKLVDSTDVVIANAGFTGNGIGIDVGSASSVRVTGSAFAGQQQFAVRNLADNARADAKGNWWGSTTGPTDAANPDGHGDPVSANIDYGQWQTRATLAAPALYLAEPATNIASQTVAVRLGCLNATEYRLSELANFAGASFAPIAAQASFRFSDGDGPKALYVQYRDATGQTVSKRLASDVVLDLSPPTLQISSPAPSSVIVAPVAIEAQAADGSGIASVEFFLGATRLGADTTAPYSQQLDTSVIPDGDYAIAAVATDNAGRTTRVEFPITVARVALPPDTVAPVVSGATLDGTAIAPDSTLTKNGQVSVIATDRSGVSRVEFLFDGSPIGSDSNAETGGVYRGSIGIAGIANGAHTLAVRAFDSLGNNGETSFPLQVQHVPPPAPTILKPTGGSVVGGGVIEVSGTAGAGNRVRLLVNGVAQEGNVTAGSNGAFQLEAQLQAGDNTLAAIATDEYGDSAPAAEVHVSVDQTVPTAPSNLQALVQAAGKVHLTWSLSSDPKAAGYDVYRAPIEFSALGEAQKIKHLAVASNVYDDVPANDGRYYYRVVTVNALGTPSVPTNQVTAVADRTLPFAEKIEYVPQGKYDASTQTYGTGRIDVKVTVNEALHGTPYLSVVPAGGMPMPVDLVKRDDTHYDGSLVLTPGSGAGVANVMFSARDVIGNRGIEVREGATVKLDTVGPALADIALVPGAPIKVDASRDVTAVFTFDEAIASGKTPTIEYRLSGAGRAPVALAGLERIDASHWRAQFQLPADAGQASVEQLAFASLASDALDNLSTQIKAANGFQVYQGALPALNVPLGLKATAQPGGKVALEWQAVEGANGYQVYRQAPDETQRTPLARSSTVTSVDATPVDGLYRYSVASIRSSNGQESQSGESAVVEARSSRTAPGAPANLELTMSSQGVIATWQPPVGTAPASYRLYRSSAAAITSVEGLTPIKQGIRITQALDAAPSPSEHAYVVTAVDAAGNESALSGSVYLNFRLLPVRTLQVTTSGTDLPVLAWTPNSQDPVSYDVYVGEGDARIKLTPAPITATTLTDTGYTGGERRYTVEVIDNNNVRMARSVTLPNATAQVVAGLPLRRNVMNRLDVQVANLSAGALAAAKLVVTVGGHRFASEEFVLAGNGTRVVPVVVGGYPDLASQTTLALSIENVPNEGELVRLGTSREAEVVDSALVVGLDAEGFVRGATGKVRLTVENTSDVEVELLTARSNGATASDELRLKLLDADGNLLGTTPYRQATGSGVVTLANGQTVARIAPGQRYQSEPFVMPVPSTSPDQVRIKLEVDQLHYDTGQPDAVAIPGMGSERTVMLSNTPYYGEVTSAEPVVSYGGQDITLQGRAVDRGTGEAVANAPLKLTINQEGFERVVDVTSDTNGQFRYVYKPSLTDSGVYHVGAIHPDMTERPDQARFTINRVSVTPALFKLSVPRNYSYRIDYRATTGTGSRADNVRVVYAAQYQPSGTLLPGITVEVPAPVNIGANQNLSLPVKVSGDNDAQEMGQIVLAVFSDGTGAEPFALQTVEYKLTVAKPDLFPTPAYVQAGLARGQSTIETVTLENKGFIAMSDVTVALVDNDGNAAPAWISLASNPQIGSLAVGDKRAIDINIAPNETVAEGIHAFRVRVEGSNLPAEYIAVTVSVTQSGLGDVRFVATDIYTKTPDRNGVLIPGLAGARVFLQNEAVISQTYEGTTSPIGMLEFDDLPAGSYKFKVSAQNHQETTGRFAIKPGLTVNQTVFLEYTLISVEWSVREITIEDRYEITLNATFETDVPAPVVVLQPTSINLPKMAPGEVFQGELTLTNYGLLRADNLATRLPVSDDYFKFEFLAQPPTSLEAKQRVRLPYRVIALRKYGDTGGTTVAASADTGGDAKGGDSKGGDTMLVGAVSRGGGMMSPANISGTAGCYTYSNAYHVTCKYTCANGVESTNCGSGANYFFVENSGCPVGSSPIGGGTGGIDVGGVGGGTGGSGPGYSEVQGLPLCTKGSGECFEPGNKQSGSGKEGGQ
jgi:fibronectin type 3 domain-containing protein